MKFSLSFLILLLSAQSVLGGKMPRSLFKRDGSHVDFNDPMNCAAFLARIYLAQQTFPIPPSGTLSDIVGDIQFHGPLLEEFRGKVQNLTSTQKGDITTVSGNIRGAEVQVHYVPSLDDHKIDLRAAEMIYSFAENDPIYGSIQLNYVAKVTEYQPNNYADILNIERHFRRKLEVSVDPTILMALQELMNKSSTKASADLIFKYDPAIALETISQSTSELLTQFMLENQKVSLSFIHGVGFSWLKATCTLDPADKTFTMVTTGEPTGTKLEQQIQFTKHGNDLVLKRISVSGFLNAAQVKGEVYFNSNLTPNKMKQSLDRLTASVKKPN